MLSTRLYLTLPARAYDYVIRISTQITNWVENGNWWQIYNNTEVAFNTSLLQYALGQVNSLELEIALTSMWAKFLSDI